MTKTKRVTFGIVMLTVAPIVMLVALVLQAWNVYFFANAIREGYGGIGSGIACIVVAAFGLWIMWWTVKTIRVGWLMLFRPTAFEAGLWDLRPHHSN
jgi:hypothetical protein